MSLQPIIEIGSPSFQMPGTKFQRRRDGLDGGTLEFFSANLVAFEPGAAAPGYSGMIIQDVETEEDAPGRYIHRLQCLGVLGSKPNRKVKSAFRTTLDTFDDGSEEWIVHGSGSIPLGSNPEGHPHMFAVDIQEEYLEAGFYRVNVSFKGLAGTTTEKPYKRRYSVNEQIISPSDPMVVLLPDGWGTPRKTQFSLPKVVVIDTYVTTSAPNTLAIPGKLTPPDPPAIQDLTIWGSNVTWNWPWGWKLASIDSDKIYGVYVTSYSYEAVWPIIPN